MQAILKRKHLIGVYVCILSVLLLCVSITPLLIHHGITLSRHLIIEEETLETILIVSLFGISFLILKSFVQTLKSYQQQVDRAGAEKSKLVSRLAEAFSYIGTVNVEIQEIESAICGVTRYPRSRREFCRLLDQLATKAMSVAGAPWTVVRMIDRTSVHTIHEHAVHRLRHAPPAVTMGNRVILDGGRVEGMQALGTRQRNLDLQTVFILPAVLLEDEKIVLLTAILNQIEVLFMLQRSGCLRPFEPKHAKQKEIPNDPHH